MSHTTTCLCTGLLLGLIGGCSTDRLAPLAPVPESVSVSPGLQPEISWSPGGAVYSITVRQAGAGPLLWTALGQLHSNAIRPAVGYGTTPPGAIATANVVYPLVFGAQYTVELGRIGDDGVVRIVGSTTFRP
jgi:hypothetical protein